jgi:hypothetical protein
MCSDTIDEIGPSDLLVVDITKRANLPKAIHTELDKKEQGQGVGLGLG